MRAAILAVRIRSLQAAWEWYCGPGWAVLPQVEVAGKAKSPRSARTHWSFQLAACYSVADFHGRTLMFGACRVGKMRIV
jgi:hypothetical protein